MIDLRNIWNNRELKGNEKTILIYLCSNYSNKYNYSYPTYEQIQNDVGISRNTLAKVLKSLELKGFITRDKHKTDKGWNNIYYINKFLVVENNEPEPTEQDTNTNTDNISNDDLESTTEPLNELSNDNQVINEVVEQKEVSSNELLLKNKANLNNDLTEDQVKQVNKLDTDKLIKAINQANKYAKCKYSLNYLLAIYNNNFSNEAIGTTTEEPHKDNKGQVVKGAYQQKFNSNKTVTTKYHNTFNEHFRKYDDLEAKLLKMQGKLSYVSNL